MTQRCPRSSQYFWQTDIAATSKHKALSQCQHGTEQNFIIISLSSKDYRNSWPISIELGHFGKEKRKAGIVQVSKKGKLFNEKLNNSHSFN